MSQNRKPRSPSKLAALPQEQREKLLHWLVQDNLTYREVVGLAQSEFGIKTDGPALCQFRSQVLQAQLNGNPPAPTNASLSFSPGSSAEILIRIEPAGTIQVTVNTSPLEKS